MLKNQPYDNNVYMKLIKFVSVFLISNVAFTVTNILLFIASLFLAISSANFIIFAIAFIAYGVSLITTMYVLDQYKEDRDLPVFKTYLIGVKKFWKQGFIYWLPVLVVSIIVCVDILAFTKLEFVKWLIPIFVIMFVITVGLGINMMYFKIKNPQGTWKDIATISVFYALKKWYVSLLNAVLLVLMTIVIFIKPQFGYLITPSIFIGLLYLNCSQLHKNKK